MSNKVMVVTGGGRGIGRAVARLAAARGYAVCLSWVGNQAAADAVVGDIEAKGGRAAAVRADIAVEAETVALFEAADQLGTVTALVNNAGIVDQASRVDEMSGDRLRRMFATNITGSFLAAREAIKRMSTRHGGQGGAIVNLSSVASRLGGGGIFVDYAASKGAIDTFTLGLAREVAGEGIRVNAVAPGLIDTDIHHAAGDPDRLKKLAPSVPMQRAGTADEVAAAILWLLSDEASYVTGGILDIGGGR